jgi:thiol-disulfide isomerase/thioredoxin
MLRRFLSLALLFTCATAVWAEDKKDAPEKSGVEQVKADPNSPAAWNAYAGEKFKAVFEVLEKDPKKALEQLTEIESFLHANEPTSANAQKMVERLKSSVAAFKVRAEVMPIPIAQLEKQLTGAADDEKALQRYTTKLSIEVGDIAYYIPEEAAAKLATGRDTLTKVRELAKDADAKERIESEIDDLKNLESAIETGRKFAKIIGTDAAPLAVEAWVNGKPLTDGDLKGKVVLLDFWAVWCGPCIATFPHLREWQDKYGDKGLVIIGMTGYYNFKWDDETKKAGPAGRGPDGKPVEVSHDEEHAMLEKFAEMHSLKHRFAIQDGKAMSEYYAVGGIPHVVIIDQQGKVQMMRVGSGDKNATAIDDLLKKLLGDKPTTK